LSNKYLHLLPQIIFLFNFYVSMSFYPPFCLSLSFLSLFYFHITFFSLWFSEFFCLSLSLCFVCMSVCLSAFFMSFLFSLTAFLTFYHYLFASMYIFKPHKFPSLLLSFKALHSVIIIGNLIIIQVGTSILQKI